MLLQPLESRGISTGIPSNLKIGKLMDRSSILDRRKRLFTSAASIPHLVSTQWYRDSISDYRMSGA